MTSRDNTTDLWTKLQRQLNASTAHLLHQGSIVLKSAHGRQLWVLRFRMTVGGQQQRRTIYIGDNAMRDRAAIWLQNLRQIAKWKDEFMACERTLACLAGVMRSQSCLYQHFEKGSRMGSKNSLFSRKLSR